MDIAIIGQACNLPGATNLREFANLIADGADAISHSGMEAPAMSNERWIDTAGYTKDHYQFDYKLFGLSLRDSLIIEPQQRLFLQHSWKALENAGYNPCATGHKVGVFSTSSDSHYQRDLQRSTLSLNNYDPFELELGANKEQQSTRVSFLLNLTGPSCGIQSACSSGLMTLHVAMQSLLMGDCAMAIAGGSCLPFPLHQGYHYREGMNWSATGKIRSFDENADGMIAGFGCVVFVLKTYEQAVRDKDTVYAVIKGSSINNDGQYKSTYTAPSSKAITENIQQLLKKTGYGADDIGFVEAHGSGTKIGDVIEASALAKVFIQQPENTLAITSVKAAVGHLDTVAGLVGLLKAVQQLNTKQISSAVNFTTLNKKISFKGTSLYVPTNPQKMDKPLGLVNSLGIGGTNCALLVTVAPVIPTPDTNIQAPINVFIGAQDRVRLGLFINQLINELEHCTYRFADVAYTLLQRALEKNILICVSASSIVELRDQLMQFDTQTANYTKMPDTIPTYSGCRVALQSSELDLSCEVKLEYQQAEQKLPAPETKQPLGAQVNTPFSILQKIWMDNLMLDTVAMNSSFISEGGHSILALSFIDDIKTHLGVQLDLDWVEKNDIFSQQLIYLNSLLSAKYKKSYVKQLKKSEGRTKAILILVHASISGYESYKSLCEHIHPDVDVIGIDSHNLYADDADIIANLDTLTSLYASAIDAELIDRSLPVVIGGWSLGGMMANLICQKLSGRFNITSLITIDSVLFSENHKEIFWDDSLKYFMDVANLLPSPEKSTSKHFRRLQNVFRAERKMAAEFSPSVFHVPLLNIVATKSKFEISDPVVKRAFYEAKKDNGWSMLNRVNTHFIQADHEEIIHPSNAAKVSQLINEFIVEHV